MKKITILFAATFITTFAFSQNDIEFTSQNQIDSFQINYPNSKTITGSVLISGGGIKNLNGLNQLKVIQGALVIINTKLLNFIGLNDLERIDGDFDITNDSSLQGFAGLEKLKSIGLDLSIESNPNLKDIHGLSSLESIGGDLDVVDNYSVKDINGLEKVLNLGSKLNITNNANLESIQGIKNINTITEVQIANNIKLPTCNVKSICAHIKTAKPILIKFNSAGCESIVEVEKACTKTSITSELKETERITIFPNPSSGIIHISVDNHEVKEISVYNLQGELLMVCFSNDFSVSDLPNGIYFLNVKTDGGTFNKKLIRQ